MARLHATTTGCTEGTSIYSREPIPTAVDWIDSAFPSFPGACPSMIFQTKQRRLFVCSQLCAMPSFDPADHQSITREKKKHCLSPTRAPALLTLYQSVHIHTCVHAKKKKNVGCGKNFCWRRDGDGTYESSANRVVGWAYVTIHRPHDFGNIWLMATTDTDRASFRLASISRLCFHVILNAARAMVANTAHVNDDEGERGTIDSWWCTHSTLHSSDQQTRLAHKPDTHTRTKIIRVYVIRYHIPSAVPWYYRATNLTRINRYPSLQVQLFLVGPFSAHGPEDPGEADYDTNDVHEREAGASTNHTRANSKKKKIKKRIMQRQTECLHSS